MATSIDRSQTRTPTPTSPSLVPQQRTSEYSSPTSTHPNQAIYAPLPTRRMLSQLLTQWQQSLSTQPTSITPTKDIPDPSRTPKVDMPPPTTPNPTRSPSQPGRTPSRLMLSPQQHTSPASASTSPHLQLTTPSHTRRASITNFLPTEALLMSPIPRARNPGGFRPTSSGSMVGDIEEGEFAPFGEVVGLVGGWEEKMRSATAWAVVNTSPAVAEEEGRREERRRSGSVEVGL